MNEYSDYKDLKKNQVDIVVNCNGKEHCDKDREDPKRPEKKENCCVNINISIENECKCDKR